MIVILFIALALCSGNCLAGYYYQTQPQVQTPFALTYDGYHANYQPYQTAPAIQYYTSNHIQAPAPFAYQPPTTSYFQRTFLQPQPIYNVAQPVPIPIQPSTAAVTLRESNNTVDTSPQMRGFIYHTDLQGGARSNVVFFSGPAPADLFQRAPVDSTSMRTPASDSVDSVAVDTAVAESQRPADHFQSILALLNQQRSSSMFVQDGILYSNNRVVANDRFLATEEQSGAAEDVLPILRSSFIGRRVTAPEEHEASASERQSKSIDLETATSERTTTTHAATTTTSTTTAASTTITEVPAAVTTTAATSTSTSSTTSQSTTSTMTPIVVAEMVES